MQNDQIRIINGNEIDGLLCGREREIIELVRCAYETHHRGHSFLPHSVFVRFPDEPTSRIIGLSAYLGESFDLAGFKWIASFPNNIKRGLERASALIVLNSTTTGRPLAIMEGSIISAKRTAASAALAARYLCPDEKLYRAGIIGCGVINYQVVNFLKAEFTGLRELIVFDTDETRSALFQEKCSHLMPDIKIRIVSELPLVLKSCSLISFATSSTQPHVSDLSACASGTVILHISLRDLTPEVILSCDNVVDDVDHICRAQTSVHLASDLTGGTDFIRGSLAEILLGRKRPDGQANVTIFSPFGLAILDLAVAGWVLTRAQDQGIGTILKSFIPNSWFDQG